MAQKTKIPGIDVSYYQGSIGYQKVKSAGVKFVILRAGLGKTAKQKDKKFETYYAGFKSVGVPVGAYWYSYATTVEQAKQEAKACLEVLKGKQFEYPIWYDIEEQKIFATGKANVSEIAATFCGILEQAGYFAGIYMSRSPATSYLTDAVANRFAVWIAEYSSTCKYAKQYGMWQYSSKGKVAGINGDVDLDYSYVDYHSIIKANGLNGFTKPEPVKPVTPPAPVEPPKVEVPAQVEPPKEEPKKEIKKGDIDLDGDVDADDANAALVEYLDTELMGGESKLTPEQREAGDMDGDGKITPDDACEILKTYIDETVMGDK